MAATFDPALTDPRDEVRQIIGDTDITAAEVQDETIEAYLNSKTVLGSALQLAYDLAAKYAKANEYTVDNQRNDNRQISANYLALASRLLVQVNAETGNLTPVAAPPMIIVTGLDDCRGPLDDCERRGRYC